MRFAAPPFDLDADPPEGQLWDADLPMLPQMQSWTCAACALDWVMRATGLVPEYDRQRAVEEIGYPDQINAQVGLTNVDGPGQALRDVLASYEQSTEQGWLNFDTAYELAQDFTGMMSGTAYYHWVAIRGVQGNNLWVANSAPGYKGIWHVLSRFDYERLGPFNVVWLVD